MIRGREATLMGMVEEIAGTLDDLARQHEAGTVDGASVGERIAQTVYQARLYVRAVREREGIPDTLPAGWNRPAPASLRELCDVLSDALEHVEIGDSFEGTITWEIVMGDDPELEGADFGLTARYRVGNRDGQGGVRVFTAGDHGPSA